MTMETEGPETEPDIAPGAFHPLTMQGGVIFPQGVLWLIRVAVHIQYECNEHILRHVCFLLRNFSG